uniref:Uncharacterized protein n=1 Tax=Anguilla anguilla TaxID=7936 RepID=A0A0E9XZI6_ANGAN
MKWAVIPTLITQYGCKYSKIKADSLHFTSCLLFYLIANVLEYGVKTTKNCVTPNFAFS